MMADDFQRKVLIVIVIIIFIIFLTGGWEIKGRTGGSTPQIFP